MSKIFTAEQYERAFLPHRLSNWEVPDEGKLKATSLKHRFDQTKPRTATTSFIAADNGHLRPGKKAPGVTAFTTTATTSREVYAHSKPRWPETNASWPCARRSTMGYKGIPTSYLPTSTIPVKTYQTPGCKDFNYH